MDTRLTICSVSFGHGRLLSLNAQLGARLNRKFEQRVIWRLAENAPVNADDRITAEHGPFVIEPGSTETSLGASYQHADALNTLVRKTETRFLLVLDPDFYILRPDWVDAIPEYMDKHELGFFGTPWHPRYSRNYRYFPAVHCMFIDLEKVGKQDLDFLPELERIELAGKRATGILDRISYLANRRRVPWDTGVRVFERFASAASLPAECTKPVFRLDPPHYPDFDAHHWKHRLIEAILPERYCYIPKRRDTYTHSGFSERSWVSSPLPDRWEESIWQGRPFGLHVRRSFNAGGRDKQAETVFLEQVLVELAASVENSPPFQPIK
jgi:hypothetical protein